MAAAEAAMAAKLVAVQSVLRGLAVDKFSVLTNSAANKCIAKLNAVKLSSIQINIFGQPKDKFISLAKE